MLKCQKKKKKVENQLGRTRFRSPLLLAWQPRCWICGAARSRPAQWVRVWGRSQQGHEVAAVPPCASVEMEPPCSAPALCRALRTC